MRQEPAKFHEMVARSVMRMRAACRMHSPDDRTNPADGGNNEIDDGAKNEDVDGGVVFLEKLKLEAEDAIGEGENAPGQHARHKQIGGMPEKSKHGKGGEQTEKSSGQDVSLRRQRLQIRHSIGNEQPSREDQRERNPSIDSGAYRGVFQKTKPMK